MLSISKQKHHDFHHSPYAWLTTKGKFKTLIRQDWLENISSEYESPADITTGGGFTHYRSVYFAS